MCSPRCSNSSRMANSAAFSLTGCRSMRPMIRSPRLFKRKNFRPGHLDFRLPGCGADRYGCCVTARVGEWPLPRCWPAVWAIADPVPERRTLAAHLMEYLSAGDFLAQWTEASGWLPTRPSALAGWSNTAWKTLFSPIAVSARGRPSDDLLVILGPGDERRTLQCIINDTTKYFILEKIVATRAMKLFQKKDPKGYTRLMTNPHFLIIQARKINC